MEVSDRMYVLDFLGTTQIYLESESKFIYKTVQLKPVKRCVCDLYLYYRDGKEEVKKLDFDFSCFITLSQDSEFLYVAAGDKRNILCYKLSDMSVEWEIKIRQDIGSIYYCNNKLYCECYNGIHIYNAKNGEFIEKLRATSCDQVFSLGGKYLCLLFGGCIRIYDMAEGQYVTKRQYFKREDDFALMYVVEQTDESTTIKFTYGKSLMPGGERQEKDIVFRLSDFCLN